jgi:hypothetical protein
MLLPELASDSNGSVVVLTWRFSNTTIEPGDGVGHTGGVVVGVGLGVAAGVTRGHTSRAKPTA